MTLQKELEILNGEPFGVYLCDPMDIPCVETSDPERLCRNPLVSVCIVAYNHEKYIREAIDGVMMQKTDFEFEVVIGEDCSTDGTREICFEYQKRFPDRIRVLWADRNVRKLGGNSARCRARCRGLYMAFCEGDDYWTDDRKLQKQVDLIRRHDAGLCVAKSVKLFPDGHTQPDDFSFPEIIPVSVFQNHYFQTSTYLVNREIFKRAQEMYRDVGRSWWDVTTVYCLSSLSKMVFLDECVSVRRITKKGIASSLNQRQFLVMVLRQYLPLYRFGPKGEVRRFFARKILAQIHQLFLFSDAESRAWLRSRRGLLIRLYFGTSLREIFHSGFKGVLDLCCFSRDAIAEILGVKLKNRRSDATSERDF